MTPRHFVKKSFLWCVLTKCLSAKCFLIKRRGANTKKGKFYFRQLKNNSAAYPIKLFAEIVTSLNWRSKLGHLSSADTSSIPHGTTLLMVSGNTKGGSITVPLTSCLTGLDQSVLQIKTNIFSSHTADSKRSDRRSMVQ